MNLQKRIDLLVRLGQYILSDDPDWRLAKQKAEEANGWFTGHFIDLATKNIAEQYLDAKKLNAFAARYSIPGETPSPARVGLVMAGNIPLVGFHDLLCTFLAGQNALIKTSSKDDILINYLAERLYDWESDTRNRIRFDVLLKGCDAYIATGSNNSARYFDYYFGKYPHIIRRNRTSVAILTGDESLAELEKLSDDVNLYFGLGCRNVTKVFVPFEYDFKPLLDSFNKYAYFIDHARYKNNYDYQLAIHLINRKYYMTNGSVLLSENTSLFSPISRLNYEFYSDKEFFEKKLLDNENLQCMIGPRFVPFGEAQFPLISDFADGVDTMEFLLQFK